MVQQLLSPDLPVLRRTWEITLVAANKSPTMVTSYVRAVNLYPGWCEESGHHVEITRARVRQ